MSLYKPTDHSNRKQLLLETLVRKHLFDKMPEENRKNETQCAQIMKAIEECRIEFDEFRIYVFIKDKMADIITYKEIFETK